MAREPANKDAPFYLAVRQAHRNIISYALETADNDWYVACARLGLTQAQFRYYCETLGFPLPSTRRRVGAAPTFTKEFEDEAVVDLDDAGQEDSNAADEDGLETVA